MSRQDFRNEDGYGTLKRCGCFVRSTRLGRGTRLPISILGTMYRLLIPGLPPLLQPILMKSFISDSKMLIDPHHYLIE